MNCLSSGKRSGVIPLAPIRPPAPKSMRSTQPRGRKRQRRARYAERQSTPIYYAAFVLDPDGNNIEVVFRIADITRGDRRIRKATSIVSVGRVFPMRAHAIVLGLEGDGRAPHLPMNVHLEPSIVTSMCAHCRGCRRKRQNIYHGPRRIRSSSLPRACCRQYRDRSDTRQRFSGQPRARFEATHFAAGVQLAARTPIANARA